MADAPTPPTPQLQGSITTALAQVAVNEAIGLLAEVSSLLLSAGSGDRAGGRDAVNHVLARIGEVTGADRSYVIMYRPETQVFDNTHEWCAPGIEPQIEVLQGVPVADVEDWVREMRAHDAVVLPDVAAIPDENRALRELLTMQGIRSLVACPLEPFRPEAGFIGIDFVSRAVTLPRDLLDTIRLAALLVGQRFRRDRAARKLARERHAVRATVASLRDTLLRLDRGLKIVAVNRAWTRSFGWPSRGSIGHHAEDFLEVGDGALLRTGLADLETGRQQDLSLVLRTVSRTEGTRVVEWHVRPLKGAGGELVGYIARLTDVTDLITLRLVTAELDGAIGTLLPAGVDAYLCDAESFRMHRLITRTANGLHAGVHADESCLDRVHADDRDRWRAAALRARSGESAEVACRWRTEDGGYVARRDRLVPIRDARTEGVSTILGLSSPESPRGE